MWGEQTGYPTVTDPGSYRLSSKLPQTVEDAITVTKHLQYQYLWVDEICISQQNAAHRASQINQMDRIYGGADLTIVAAAGNNKNYGLPGVGSTPRAKTRVCHLDEGVVFSVGPAPQSSIKSSVWWSRGW